MDRKDWMLCRKCGSRHPDEMFLTDQGEPRKTCKNCRSARNKRRRESCTCRNHMGGRCLHCRAKKKAEEEKELEESPIVPAKYASWELFGGDPAYLMLHTKPLREITKIYECIT